MLESLEDEGGTVEVEVVIGKVPTELDVETIEPLIELLDGAERAEESVLELDGDTVEDTEAKGVLVRDTDGDCGGNKPLVTPPMMDAKPSGPVFAVEGV